MSDFKENEVIDPNEQNIWDSMVEMIQNLAKMVQKNNFYKYKLAYRLQTANANTLNYTSVLADTLTNNINDFKKHHANNLKQISELYAANKDKPVIEIMLDTTKQNLNKIYTYNELHEPTLDSLINQRNTIENSLKTPQNISPQIEI